ncbi:MAG: flavodoxin family protein [Desulfobacteraceae bacterium]|nr:MAG: flavodoxin family protein [Desulfobacteraceae bacterium]
MITIINVSPRIGGINDQICDRLCRGITSANIDFQYIKLRELSLKFCTNCRTCMRTPGKELGPCSLQDDMAGLLQCMLQSKQIIVSSPINCYDLPSLFRVMIERMGGCAYWSEEMYSPKVRAAPKGIKGILITTSALPGPMIPFLTGARKTFKLFARPLGIKKIKYYHFGLKGRAVDMVLKDKDRQMIEKIVKNIIKPF